MLNRLFNPNYSLNRAKAFGERLAAEEPKAHKLWSEDKNFSYNHTDLGRTYVIQWACGVCFGDLSGAYDMKLIQHNAIRVIFRADYEQYAGVKSLLDEARRMNYLDGMAHARQVVRDQIEEHDRVVAAREYQYSRPSIVYVGVDITADQSENLEAVFDQLLLVKSIKFISDAPLMLGVLQCMEKQALLLYGEQNMVCIGSLVKHNKNKSNCYHNSINCFGHDVGLSEHDDEECIMKRETLFSVANPKLTMDDLLNHTDQYGLTLVIVPSCTATGVLLDEKLDYMI